MAKKENEKTENVGVVEIYATSREFKRSELYVLTQGVDNTSIKDIADGTPILCTDYISFSKVDSDGKEVTLFGVTTASFETVFLTQSETFRKEFMSMLSALNDGEISKDKPLPIIKISGTSKSGREYVSCKPDMELYIKMYE